MVLSVWYGLYGNACKTSDKWKITASTSNYSKVVCRAKTDPHTLRNSKYSLISLSGKTDDPCNVGHLVGL
jgi:hypothetical protein